MRPLLLTILFATALSAQNLGPQLNVLLNEYAAGPTGDLSISGSGGVVTANYSAAFPTLCRPESTPTGPNCRLILDASRSIPGSAISFTPATSTGVAINPATSSITFSMFSNGVLLNAPCVGSTANGACTPESGTGGFTTSTFTGQIRIFDVNGACLWCSDLQGSVDYRATVPASLSLLGAVTETRVDVVGLQFVPLPPCRVADTRDAAGPYGQPVLFGNTTRSFVMAGRCGIPAGAAAVSLNVTVAPRGPLGYLAIYPYLAPGANNGISTLNSLDGRIKANAAIVRLGGDEKAVTVYGTHTTDVVLDVNGYFISPVANSLAFYPIPPCRVIDTRNGAPLLQGVSRTIPVRTSACGIPAGAQAYSLNATVVPPAGIGFLTLWPTGTAQPTVSTLNALTGTVVANAAIVPAGTDGSIDAYASGTTDLVLDINGYFAPPGGGLNFFPLERTCRVGDTRSDPVTGLEGGILRAATPRVIESVLRGCFAPGAKAYVLNATLVPSQPVGFLTLYPANTLLPLVSTLNALDGAITSNLAIVPVSSDSIAMYSTQSAHLVLDASGYFK